MASAKSEAIKYLGNENKYINLTGLNKERDLANQVYNTNATSFQNAYNDLLSTIANNRQKARTDFNTGRGTISENAYMRNRENTSDLASRGLNGGLAQLSKLGNRMETGRQYSDLANTYYNTLNELDATQKTGENEYNTNIESAKNTLAAALADIGTREANARNAYKGAVAQLAEQIQSRRAAQAQAAAAQRAAAAQIKAAANAANAELNARLFGYAGEDVTDKSFNSALKYYKSIKGGSDDAATKYLNSIGIFAPAKAKTSTTTGTVKTAKSTVNKNNLSTVNTLLGNRYVLVDDKGKPIY